MVHARRLPICRNPRQSYVRSWAQSLPPSLARGIRDAGLMLRCSRLVHVTYVRAWISAQGRRSCWAQVSCNPPGLIVVDVQQLRTTAGGYIKLALDSVKGPGQLTGVALRQTPSPVRCRRAAALACDHLCRCEVYNTSTARAVRAQRLRRASEADGDPWHGVLAQAPGHDVCQSHERTSGTFMTCQKAPGIA